MQMVEAGAITSRGDIFRTYGLYGTEGSMHGTGLRHLLSYSNSTEPYNSRRVYSPITLNTEWNTLLRLTILISFSVIGTIINGFFISSFFIESALKKIGNVYLACVGLADLVITAGVMPASAVVLLSGIWDMEQVCYGLQFATQASIYTYSLLFLMVAVENYIRICTRRACYAKFLKVNVGVVSALIFVAGFSVSGIGVFIGMEYDYCNRNDFGNYIFRLVTSVVFQAIPCVLTISLLTIASNVVRARARRLVHYKRSQQFDQDYQFTNLNICGYVLFVTAWIPYLVIVNQYPSTADENYYTCVWVGLSRSIVTSFLYNLLNSNFRQAFSHLFNYCCCKISLTSPFNDRHRPVLNAPAGDMRLQTHLMQICTPGNRSGIAAHLRDVEVQEM